VLKLLLWVCELWLDRTVGTDNEPGLKIWDRYFHDLLVDPVRYRYGGPMWVVRSLTRWIPTPDLFIILDGPAHVLQARKQEVTPEETARQLCAYRDLAARLEGSVVVNVARDLDSVISDAATATKACLERKRSMARHDTTGV
jgi:thymidylate kinase